MMTAIACEVRAKEASSLLKFVGNAKGVADGKAKNGVIELFVIRENYSAYISPLFKYWFYHCCFFAFSSSYSMYP